MRGSCDVHWSGQRPPQRLEGLQACRMIAAIGVVLFHANNFVLPLRLYDGAMVWRGFGMGYAGVEFFFVLSGFIIAHIHAADFSRPERARRFLRKRFLRIYPPYWIVLSGLVLLYAAADGLVDEDRLAPSALLRDFLLLPAPQGPLLPVAWTLKHEILFYMLFLLFIIAFEIGLGLFTIWMIGTLVQMVSPSSWYPMEFLFSPYNVLFVIGVLVAGCYRRLPAGGTWPLIIAGSTGFLLVGLSEQYLVVWPLPLRCLAYGIVAAAVIAALARARTTAPAWCVFLGNASYAIYLIHLPAMNILAVPMAMLGLQVWMPPLATLFLLTAFAVVLGALFHQMVERRLLAALSAPRRKGL
ncbi:acyltransferase family protein [Rhodobacter sphaeroides]|uniref:Acyltransferase 3 family n=2 Tax=Cereibacter sphaeroides TaxID=1063 RepID=Q3IV74_CERS4|nr:acyltransferase [Cereibacter sphaeroides]ABA81560.1 Acyltransferase 3 family [Cereibacter sphaeroides 2.4.1]AXC63988.1 acyltransferase [Cereibacter sphaeroides 2.4.1]MVX50428.1 acyltransferase family protein [Cereibacter sphaeroides]QHA15467.1 acyltransferase family protein [Cereibacter sphaeroides]QJC86789.1 acyltransferase [Cereibacter sphaeroides]